MSVKSREQIAHYPNALTRNVDLMADELSILGYVTPEVQALTVDEEHTQAVEILAAQERSYAVVPRVFEIKNNDLVDRYGLGLNKILDDGINSIQAEVDGRVPGADWELERRVAERANARKIIAMPPGTMCVETSVTPFDKPEGEQLAQHYTGLTMVRASIKDRHQSNKIIQYNYVLPLPNPDFAITLQEKFGIKGAEFDSLNLLTNPHMQEFNGDSKQAGQTIDSLIGAALLETSLGHSAVRMIKKAIDQRREAWEFVNSKAHADIDRELLDKMEVASTLPPAQREHMMRAIRSGYHKALKERFNGRQVSAAAGSVLEMAASQAVADGDVFISCGNTVMATAFGAKGSAASRSATIDSLLSEVKGSGSCVACGARGLLFGCGFCSRCNQIWCGAYKNGKQLSVEEVAYRGYGRSTTDQSDLAEGLLNYFQEVASEVKQRQELQKLKEARAKKLKEEQELAQAALSF